MSTSAVVLMTALVPTLGHKALIDFALNFADHVDVIISTRSIEPVPGRERVVAFREHYYNPRRDGRVVIIHHADDDAPQNPSTPEEWDYWKKTVTGNDFRTYDYVVASEPYGKKVAEIVGAEFIPFDPDRNFLSIRGTDVRKHIDWRFKDLLPEFAKRYRKTITFFGQESTGKSTMTQAMNAEYMSYATHEFARPYLEAMDDKTVTHEKMCRIADGQYALQKTSHVKTDMPFIFQDTDLLSTIGYNRIYGGEPIPGIERRFEETKSDLYVVMNDEIPFEEDALRYGGKVRESTKQFWIDLLEEFGCDYYVVQATNPHLQMNELYGVIGEISMDTWGAIMEFERE